MQVYLVMAQRVKEIGITKAELARRIDIDDELLRRSLAGKRKISAEEFVLLCYELDLTLADFDIRQPQQKRRIRRKRVV